MSLRPPHFEGTVILRQNGATDLWEAGLVGKPQLLAIEELAQDALSKVLQSADSYYWGRRTGKYPDDLPWPMPISDWDKGYIPQMAPPHPTEGEFPVAETLSELLLQIQMHWAKWIPGYETWQLQPYERRVTKSGRELLARVLERDHRVVAENKQGDARSFARLAI